MMRRETLLAALQWALIGLGAMLAVWCAVTIVETHYVQSMPIPSARTALPGDWSNGGYPRGAIAAGTWLARLDAPSVHLSATVLEGSDDRTLSRAAGHLEETPRPGERGNVAIAGHRDTIFRPLRDLHAGDRLTLTTADRVYWYRVASTNIVEPDDVRVLEARNRPTLTLVTCYPFTFIGQAPQRYVVSADLVGEELRGPRDGNPLRSGESGGPGKSGQ